MYIWRGITLAAALGLLLMQQRIALAQSGSEDSETMVIDQKIDCSTNQSYSDKNVARTFGALKGVNAPQASNQQCNACHKTNSPTVGSGKPLYVGATALVQNRLSDTNVTYMARFGKKAEWKEYVLKPGAIQRHTWDYSEPTRNQNKSPEFYLKFEDSKGNLVERTLPLIATPNPKLGSIYYFDTDDDDKLVYLWKPNGSIARGR
jgi:hypothetical protein